MWTAASLCPKTKLADTRRLFEFGRITVSTVPLVAVMFLLHLLGPVIHLNLTTTSTGTSSSVVINRVHTVLPGTLLGVQAV